MSSQVSASIASVSANVISNIATTLKPQTQTPKKIISRNGDSFRLEKKLSLNVRTFSLLMIWINTILGAKGEEKTHRKR